MGEFDLLRGPRRQSEVNEQTRISTIHRGPQLQLAGQNHGAWRAIGNPIAESARVLDCRLEELPVQPSVRNGRGESTAPSALDDCGLESAVRIVDAPAAIGLDMNSEIAVHSGNAREGFARCSL